MASGINEAALTLAALEVMNSQEFIIEKVFQRSPLANLHDVRTGVTMKEQIVFAGQFGLVGLKGDGTCARKTSGATSVLSQKYWEPQGIEDTLIHCNAELDGLFKAYYTKIQNYIQKYEISGTDLEAFLTILIDEAMLATIYRAVWLGDKNVAASQAGLAGLVAGANSVYFDYIDGIWHQVFAAVSALTLPYYQISENSQITIALQLTLAANRAEAIFEEMWAVADPRLKADPTAVMMVSNALWENYRKGLISKSLYTGINYTMDGLRSIKWNGIEVVNMETIWDLPLFAYFEDNSVNHAYYLPNRALLTTKTNIPVGTLNVNDLTALEIFYEKVTRSNYMGFGFSLDAKLLEEYMAVAAF
jgi:hypothetical protein